LSDQDLLRIDRRRRDSNRFGFAVQLCLLLFPGGPPDGSTFPSHWDGSTFPSHWLLLLAATQE
jgi:hypothetical protein